MAHAETRPDREMIPRVLLRAMFGLCAVCLALVTYARLTDRPLEAMPPNLPIVQERTLILYGDIDGSARVLDGQGTQIAAFPADKGGFVAGMQRALARERIKHGTSVDLPVRLVRFSDGHLGLRDDFTGWRTELIGFGADNTAVFERLMQSK